MRRAGGFTQTDRDVNIDKTVLQSSYIAYTPDAPQGRHLQTQATQKVELWQQSHCLSGHGALARHQPDEPAAGYKLDAPTEC